MLSSLRWGLVGSADLRRTMQREDNRRSPTVDHRRILRNYSVIIVVESTLGGIARSSQVVKEVMITLTSAMLVTSQDILLKMS